MISVYLYNEDWVLYQFEDWFEARQEFRKRSITVAENCILQLCYISNCVTIRSGTIINKDVKIEPGVLIEHNCLIRENCHIGINTTINNSVILEKGVTIGCECYIGNNIHLSYRATVDDYTFLKESIYISNEFFDRCVSYVGKDKFHKGCFPFHILNESSLERKQHYKDLIIKNPRQERNDNVVKITETLIGKVLKPFLKYIINK